MTTPNVFTHKADWPTCPYCGRGFTPGSHWQAANFCRAAFLLERIAVDPGLSGAELAQTTGMPYALVVGGLEKARSHNAVEFTSEERDAGGVRYRYSAAENWRDIVDDWRKQGLL